MSLWRKGPRKKPTGGKMVKMTPQGWRTCRRVRKWTASESDAATELRKKREQVMRRLQNGQ